jgi:hypothetical protein
MKRIAGVMAFVLLCAPAAEGAAPPAVSPAARVARLAKEQKEALDAFWKTAGTLPDTPEGRKKLKALMEEIDKAQTARFDEALRIAKADPQSDGALAALEWLLTIPRNYYLPIGKEALELVVKYHAGNPKVGKIVGWIGYYRPWGCESEKVATALIEAVAKSNKDRTARGQAFMAMAWEAGQKFAVAEYKKAKDAEELAGKAEKAFELVVKDYGDCPRLLRDGRRTLGEEAKQELFELRRLRIGKAAPEIDGEDLDGKKFKLSDYRGKVVVLDFWGDW